MTEILTESFCERCGTRYTFETASHRARPLSRLSTLGRGLRHYLATEDASLDESMAVARSDDEQRSATAQLEAFHRTFNFCLSCRQYTCTECWNPVEGRCLSCAPLPYTETIAPAATLSAPVMTIAAPPQITRPPIEILPREAPFQPSQPSGWDVEPEPEPETEAALETEAASRPATEDEPIEATAAAPVEAEAAEPEVGEPEAVEPAEPEEPESIFRRAEPPAPDADGFQPPFNLAPPVAAPAEPTPQEPMPLEAALPMAEPEAEAPIAEPEVVQAEAEAQPEPVSRPEAVVAEPEVAEAGPAAAPTPEQPRAGEPLAEEPVAETATAAPEVAAAPEGAAAPEPVPPTPSAPPEPAPARPARSSGPIAPAGPESAPSAIPRPVATPWDGFQPGRSLDEEIAAYELRVAALAAVPPEPALPPITVTSMPAAERPAAQAPADAGAAAARPSAVRSESLSPMPGAAIPPPLPEAPTAGEATQLHAVGSCRNCGLSISASARFCRRCGTRQDAA